jgi:hypothetical protein
MTAIPMYASSETPNLFVTRRDLVREYLRRVRRWVPPVARWSLRALRIVAVALLRLAVFVCRGPALSDGRRKAKEIVLRF